MTDETRIKNLEIQFKALAERLKDIEVNSEKGIDKKGLDITETNRNIAEVKTESKETTASLEETAITMADFLAEYYLSQLGIDDFDMEGGEEE